MYYIKSYEFLLVPGCTKHFIYMVSKIERAKGARKHDMTYTIQTDIERFTITFFNTRVSDCNRQVL